MALTGNHQPGEPGHHLDHNLLDQAVVTDLPNAINSKVGLTGNESVAGDKTFTGNVEVNRLVKSTLTNTRETMRTSGTTSENVYFVSTHSAATNIYRFTFAGALTISWVGIPAISSGIAVGVTLICVGPTSIVWPAGTRFNGGVVPTISGETWFTCVAQEGVVTVGTAYQSVA